MSLKSEKINDSFYLFPANNNVRITITGLAVCEFNSNTSIPSLIHFLSHVKHHELRVTIRRKPANSSNFETVLPMYTIDKNSSNISVFGSSMEIQPNYQHTPQTGEFPLNKLLHLSELHNTRFKRNTKKSILMSLSHCSFYTKDITKELYYVINLLPTTESPQPLGKVLGAYMNASGTINIEIDGRSIFQRLIVDQGIKYEYEIEFTNHCEEDKPACEAVVGSIETDLKFLYDIIKPPKNILQRIKLFKVEIPVGSPDLVTMSPNVAACLPAITEPCDGCS